MYFVILNQTLGWEHLADLGRAFRKLSNNPYWNRAWIVQGLILARHILLLFGSDAIDWEAFKEMANYMQEELPHRRSSDFDRPQFADHILGTQITSIARAKGNHYLQAFGLVEFLLHFRGNECSNHLDRIYAFLHVAKRPSRCKRPIQVDYTKTPLDLAMECLEHLDDEDSVMDPVDQTGLMFKTLQLDPMHPELAARAIHNRVGAQNLEQFEKPNIAALMKVDTGSGNAVNASLTRDGSGSEERLSWSAGPASVTRIQYSREGFLQANFRYREPAKVQDAEIAIAFATTNTQSVGVLPLMNGSTKSGLISRQVAVERLSGPISRQSGLQQTRVQRMSDTAMASR